MKQYITEEALGQFAWEYAKAKKLQHDATGDNPEYFLGKKVAIADTAAYFLGVTYGEACIILEKRAKNL